MEYGDFRGSSRSTTVPNRNARVIVPQDRAQAFVAMHEQNLRANAGSSSRQTASSSMEKHRSFMMPMQSVSTASIDAISAAKQIRSTLVSISSANRDPSRFPYASNFRAKLSKVLKHVVRLKLVSVEFQSPENVISSTNNRIQLDLTDESSYQLTVPVGNWSPKEVSQLIQLEMAKKDPFLVVYSEINKETQITKLEVFRLSKIEGNQVYNQSRDIFTFTLPATIDDLPEKGSDVLVLGLETVPSGPYKILDLYKSLLGTKMSVRRNVPLSNNSDIGSRLFGASGWVGLPISSRFDFSLDRSVGPTLGFYAEKTSENIADVPTMTFNVHSVYYYLYAGPSSSASQYCLFIDRRDWYKFEGDTPLYRGQRLKFTESLTQAEPSWVEVLDVSPNEHRVWVRKYGAETKLSPHGVLPPIMMSPATPTGSSSLPPFSYRHIRLDVATLVNGTSSLTCDLSSLTSVGDSRFSLGFNLYKIFCTNGIGETLDGGPYVPDLWPSPKPSSLYVIAVSPTTVRHKVNRLNQLVGLQEGRYVFLVDTDPQDVMALAQSLLLPIHEGYVTRFYLEAQFVDSEYGPDRKAQIPLDFCLTNSSTLTPSIVSLRVDSDTRFFPTLLVPVEQQYASLSWVKVGAIVSIKTSDGDALVLDDVDSTETFNTREWVCYEIRRIGQTYQHTNGKYYTELLLGRGPYEDGQVEVFPDNPNAVVSPMVKEIKQSFSGQLITDLVAQRQSIRSFVYIPSSDYWADNPDAALDLLNPWIVFGIEAPTASVPSPVWTIDDWQLTGTTFLEAGDYDYLFREISGAVAVCYISKSGTVPTQSLYKPLVDASTETLNVGIPRAVISSQSYDLGDDAHLLWTEGDQILQLTTYTGNTLTASSSVAIGLDGVLAGSFALSDFSLLRRPSADNYGDTRKTLILSDNTSPTLLTDLAPSFHDPVYDWRKHPRYLSTGTQITDESYCELARSDFVFGQPTLTSAPSASGPFSTELRRIGKKTYTEDSDSIGVTFSMDNPISVDDAYAQGPTNPLVKTASRINPYNNRLTHYLGTASLIQLLPADLSNINEALRLDVFGRSFDTYSSDRDNGDIECWMPKSAGEKAVAAFRNAQYFVANEVDIEFQDHGFNEIVGLCCPKDQTDLVYIVTKLEHGKLGGEECSFIFYDGIYAGGVGEIVKVTTPHSFYLRLPKRSSLDIDEKAYTRGFLVSTRRMDIYGITSLNSNNIGLFKPSDFLWENCRLSSVVDRHRFRLCFPFSPYVPQISLFSEQGGGAVRISSSIHGFSKVHINKTLEGRHQAPILLGNSSSPFYYLLVRVPGYVGTQDPGILNDIDAEYVIGKVLLSDTNTYLFNTFVAAEHVFSPVLVSKVEELDVILRTADGSLVDMENLNFSFTLQFDQEEDYLEADGVIDTQPPKPNANMSV